MEESRILTERATITRLVAYIKDMSHQERRDLLNYIESKGMMREKRKYPRQECDLSVSFDAYDQSFDGVISNISVEGAFIETDKRFEIGEPIKMTFTLPSESYPLIASGWVARKTKTGLGVKFDTSDYETEFISSLLLLNSKQYFMAFKKEEDQDESES